MIERYLSNHRERHSNQLISHQPSDKPWKPLAAHLLAPYNSNRCVLLFLLWIYVSVCHSSYLFIISIKARVGNPGKDSDSRLQANMSSQHVNLHCLTTARGRLFLTGSLSIRGCRLWLVNPNEMIRRQLHLLMVIGTWRRFQQIR